MRYRRAVFALLVAVALPLAGVVLAQVAQQDPEWRPRIWVGGGGIVSERGSDSPRVNFRGIQDERGRLMVVMAHNTDIPDTWEREGESKEYFDRFSPNGYALGVNIMIYAMTH